jgi:hypothetical protein
LGFRFRICFVSDFVLPLLFTVLVSLTSIRSVLRNRGPRHAARSFAKTRGQIRERRKNTKLNNGLRVIVASRPELPLLAAEILVSMARQSIRRIFPAPPA